MDTTPVPRGSESRPLHAARKQKDMGDFSVE